MELRLEDLLGREVLAGNNRRVGRIEEFRAETTAKGCVITAYVIGVAGLYERFGVATKSIVGAGRSGRLARWDQIDLSHPQRPRLTCPVEELETI